jgi:N-acyl homoserine lactone hydrolase
MSLKNLVGLIGFSLLLGLAPAFAADNVPEIRLYAIDCGSLDIKDVGSLFSDTGEFAGEPGTMVDPCYCGAFCDAIGCGKQLRRM